MEALPKIQYYSKTASDDNPFRMIDADVWVREANIHCLTNNALYGDAYTQNAPFNTGDVISFQDFNLGELYFKNATAGSNTVIRITCIIMGENRRIDLGL